MTNPTRTRAEIQAEIEHKIQLFEAAAFASGRATGAFEAKPNEHSSKHSFEAACNLITRNTELVQALKAAAADLITREDHERLLEEAGGKLTSLDANTAVKYLASEYDLDTGHMDTAEPRWYPFDHNGHIYEVVVRRKGEADVAPSQAVAPKGVVEELRKAAHNLTIWYEQHMHDKATEAQLAGAREVLNAALARITELPEPSEWARNFAKNLRKDIAADINAPEARELAAALLAKEGDHD